MTIQRSRSRKVYHAEPLPLDEIRACLSPRDEAWWERAAPSVEGTLRQSPSLEPLNARLLSAAGYWAILPVIEEDLEALLERGRFVDGRGARMRKMADGRCHRNAGEIFEREPDRYAIMTGYALSRDGVWRQHSWAWDRKRQQVVETTTPRILYFGFELSEAEATDFAFANAY